MPKTKAQGSFKVNLWAFQGSFKGISMECKEWQGIFEGALKKFKDCFKDVSMELQENIKVFQKSCRDV